MHGQMLVVMLKVAQREFLVVLFVHPRCCEDLLDWVEEEGYGKVLQGANLKLMLSKEEK